jgi:hypothetical protein
MSAVVVMGVRSAPEASEPAVRALALQEARRLLLHPVLLVGFAALAVTAGDELLTSNSSRGAFTLVDSVTSYFPGVFAVLAANLVASRDARAGADDLVGSAPLRAAHRTRALCLASLAPAALALVAVAGMHLALLADDRYLATPSVWHVLQGPVTVLGGCLFGVLVARWLPYRGAAVVALVALVAANVWTADGGARHPFGFMVSWAAWGPYGDLWVGLVPGSAAWHVAYLLGLCGLAAAGAVLRDSRRSGVIELAALSAVLAVAGGVGQLP